jgi:RNA polymerase sigma-70 factor (ECF subfamily)
MSERNSPNATRDRAIAERIQQGDEEALTELFQLYFAELANYAFRYLGSRDDAKDIVQDVFFWLWVHREAWTTEQIAGFLYRLTRNRALKVIRHDRVIADYEALVIAEEPVAENEGAAEVDASDLRAAVDRAVGLMPPRVREVFLLNREQGLSYKEIAEALEISVNTVETQMGKALRIVQTETQGLRGP